MGNENDRGITVTDFDGISSIGVNHFKRIFSNPRGTSIAEVVKIASLFPSFVDDVENENLRREISTSELLSTLHTFQRDKSPDSDGWPIKFYLGFYELIGADLLKVVEESRIMAYIHPPVNSTFLALIPKKDRPETFDDFRPISLCNCLYKIISKIIANRLKKILSLHISKEQFGFLEGRQIHEAIGVVRKGLHSIKSKHLRGVVLKIDLSKAVDRVNWLYIRLLLTHMGFHIDFIHWIMSCLTSVSFAILINGATSPSFFVDLRIRQGCPLSSLLFLLVAEGLSHFIITARVEGNFRGISISPGLSISHLLFVDDILIFCDGSCRSLHLLVKGIKLFHSAIGMLINEGKSSVNWANLSLEDTRILSSYFNFHFHELDAGVKYLGFFLKPNNYRKHD